jgi:PST family polysaccharide transporter
MFQLEFIFSVCLFCIPQLQEEKEVAFYSFITCFATVLTQNWLFQAMQDLHKIAILSLIGKVIFTTLILCTIKEKSDYFWQPLALSLSQIFVGVISFFWAIKLYRLQLVNFNIKSCLELLWNEKKMFFTLCFISFYTTTTTVVLGISNDSEAVGFYSAGQKLISIIQMMVIVPFSQALFPFIGKSLGESEIKGIIIVQKIIPIVFTLTLICGILTILFAPQFIRFFYGNAFQPSVIVCRILAFVPMFISLSTVLGIHVMVNLRMDKEFLKITLFGAFTGLILNLLLVRTYSYIGASITLLIVEGIIFAMLLITLSKRKIEIINFEYFKPKYFRNIFLLQIFKLKQRIF